MQRHAASIYLDTNVFVHAFEGADEWASHARAILDFLSDGFCRPVTSELTLAELVAGCDLGDSAELTLTYSTLITDSLRLRVVPVERPILLAAARIETEGRRLRLPDAIHAASAIAADCPFVVSNDADFDRVKAFRRLPIADASLATLRTFTP
jgi:predicted nucleic acid-binding protein